MTELANQDGFEKLDNHTPNFLAGVRESWQFGFSKRASSDPDDRSSFEEAMKNAGVGAMNFRLQMNGDYTIPAIQVAWMGWQGKPINL